VRAEVGNDLWRAPQSTRNPRCDAILGQTPRAGTVDRGIAIGAGFISDRCMGNSGVFITGTIVPHAGSGVCGPGVVVAGAESLVPGNSGSEATSRDGI
jgi:hypothetical protein